MTAGILSIAKLVSIRSLPFLRRPIPRLVLGSIAAASYRSFTIQQHVTLDESRPNKKPKLDHRNTFNNTMAPITTGGHGPSSKLHSKVVRISFVYCGPALERSAHLLGGTRSSLALAQQGTLPLSISREQTSSLSCLKYVARLLDYRHSGHAHLDLSGIPGEWIRSWWTAYHDHRW